MTKTWYEYEIATGDSGRVLQQAEKPPVREGFDWTDIPLPELVQGARELRGVAFLGIKYVFAHDTQKWSVIYNVAQGFGHFTVYYRLKNGTYHSSTTLHGNIDSTLIPNLDAFQFVPFQAQIDDSQRIDACNAFDGFRVFCHLDSDLYLNNHPHSTMMIGLSRTYGDDDIPDSAFTDEHKKLVLLEHKAQTGISLTPESEGADVIIRDIMRWWRNIRFTTDDLGFIMHYGNRLIARLSDKTGVATHLEFNIIIDLFDRALRTEEKRKLFRAIRLFFRSQAGDLSEVLELNISHKRQIDAIIASLTPEMMAMSATKMMNAMETDGTTSGEGDEPQAA